MGGCGLEAPGLHDIFLMASEVATQYVPLTPSALAVNLSFSTATSLSTPRIPPKHAQVEASANHTWHGIASLFADQAEALFSLPFFAGPQPPTPRHFEAQQTFFISVGFPRRVA